MREAFAGHARLESLDVLKGGLIILVVFGHLLEYFIADDPLFKAVFSAIYLFHIPLFVLLGGMLAKPALGERDYHVLFARLLLPLALLQVIYLVYLQHAQGNALKHLLDPFWMLWFLLSMCLWRLMLPVFLHLPAALPVSLALALVAGFSDHIGYDLSLSRTFYFFPFFLVGYLGRERLTSLVQRAVALWRLLFCLLMAGVLMWSLQGLNNVVLFGSQGYTVAVVWTQHPALGRLCLLLLSALGCLGFMAMMPVSAGWLARMGQRTLTIYCLHGFVVMACYKLFKLFGLVAMPALLPALLSLAVAVSWGVSWLDTPFNRGLDRLADKLLRRS